ncbi:carbamoyltransferase family protein [Chondromyces crocatus]|uniref:Carbamoyltransferase n=1 Tax=Chondromyces crocatus TaxID=52 RepID=A0A0K1E9N9_CHOCO|nr:carbamoyltransferase C-terminal domain-containing protein [Chondromyces crocatus]AKT37586.1 carbamoyltransferase [Chondromyces crocatus]
MKILGICHDVLICSAAVVVDGRVTAAIPEERLDRQKQSRVFPRLAIQRCLEMSGLKLTDIDEIAVAWNPAIDMETIPSGYLNARRWRTEHLSQVPARFMQLLGTKAEEAFTVQGGARDCPPITYLNHYHAHLGNALMVCPHEETAVLVMDGRAEKQTSLLGVARGASFETLCEVNFPHSLGLFYGTITQFLGFTPDSDEWKVMALAAFAEEDNELIEPLRRLIQVNEDGSFELALEYFAFYNFFERRMYSERFVQRFGAPRARNAPLTQRDYKLAAAMQCVFEETMTSIATILHRRTGLDRLAVSGGCFMNSVFNGKITQVTPFKECFLSSCPDDSGTSIGAALFLHAQRTANASAPREVVRHSYWGPSFSDEACLEAARRYRLPNVEVVSDPSTRAAEDLANGRILGWFQGAMEFGQRALGNRSILLDPRREDGKAVVNAAVKFRESFRPFAPAILAERVADWFECSPETRVPFMERVLMFRPERRAHVPAVTHADGSGRLQTVEHDVSPRFHALISAFEQRTGVPIVLNTSFNLNGEPIVCAPEDAIRTFYTCALDVLYLGNVRIAK